MYTTSGKFCIDCRHAYGRSTKDPDPKCLSPQAPRDAVDKSRPYCEDMRKDSVYCGPDGRWFEKGQS